MAFIKLHRYSKDVLVNTVNISYIKKYEDSQYHSEIYFNSNVGGSSSGSLYVDETLEEIADLINQSK